jgi:hypothetical protein
MTRSCDLGSGPHRPFGAALRPALRGIIETPAFITERPLRLRGSPPCPVCGEARFYCHHEGDDK